MSTGGVARNLLCVTYSLHNFHFPCAIEKYFLSSFVWNVRTLFLSGIFIASDRCIFISKPEMYMYNAFHAHIFCVGIAVSNCASYVLAVASKRTFSQRFAQVFFARTISEKSFGIVRCFPYSLFPQKCDSWQKNERTDECAEIIYE